MLLSPFNPASSGFFLLGHFVPHLLVTHRRSRRDGLEGWGRGAGGCSPLEVSYQRIVETNAQRIQFAKCNYPVIKVVSIASCTNT